MSSIRSEIESIGDGAHSLLVGSHLPHLNKVSVQILRGSTEGYTTWAIGNRATRRQVRWDLGQRLRILQAGRIYLTS